MSDSSTAGSTVPIFCKGLPGLWNSAACGETLAKTIGSFAMRPPRGMRIYKFGSRSVVGLKNCGDADEAVLKYYYPTSHIRSVAYGIRGSRCMRSWNAGLAFRHIGIPTPAPLVVAEAHGFGGFMLGHSFLATRPAEGMSLTNLVSRNGPEHDLVHQAADSLRESFRIMEIHGCVHGDLKASNLIVSPQGVAFFIDLDAAAWNLSPSAFAKQRLKDEKRFMENWKSNPAAARIFARCFREN